MFEKTAKSKGSTPDIESYVVLGESKKEASSVHRMNFRKHGSQESLNSQGSSFEYVSACQDEPLTPRADDRLRLSLSPGSDQGSCGNGGFEMIKSGNHFPPLSSSHQNDASPGKLESLSSPSSGVLSSPEYENSFEKVNGAGDIEHPNRSQDELNEEAIVDQIQQVCDLTSVSSSEENIENDIDSPLVGDAAKSCSLQTDARHEEATQPSEECPTEDTHILNETPIEVTKHEEDPETSISHVQSELPSDVVSSPLSQEDHLQPDDILTPATETTSVLQPSIINNSSASLAQDFGLDVSHTEVGENVIEVQRPDVDNAPLIDEHDTVPVQWHESALGEDGH